MSYKGPEENRFDIATARVLDSFAQRLSRRSMLTRVGKLAFSVLGVSLVPLLPVDRIVTEAEAQEAAEVRVAGGGRCAAFMDVGAISVSVPVALCNPVRLVRIRVHYGGRVVLNWIPRVARPVPEKLSITSIAAVSKGPLPATALPSLAMPANFAPETPIFSQIGVGRLAVVFITVLTIESEADAKQLG